MSLSALPDGWSREEVKRSNGLSSGKIDVCYISPDGQKIKSKAELSQYLGPNVDLTTFDFKTGRINSALLRRPKNRRTGIYDYRSLKMDQSLTPPTRQTPSISKTPVTVVSTQPHSTVYNYQQIKDYSKRHNMSCPIEPKSDSYQKPYQVFWQKRLQGRQAKVNASDGASKFELPPNIKAFMTSLADHDTLLRSVTASLHLNVQTVRGQDKHLLHKKKESIEVEEDEPRNPGAFVNPHQPLILSTTVTEDDIRRQEELVTEARQKLTSVIQDLYL